MYWINQANQFFSLQNPNHCMDLARKVDFSFWYDNIDASKTILMQKKKCLKMFQNNVKIKAAVYMNGVYLTIHVILSL